MKTLMIATLLAAPTATLANPRLPWARPDLATSDHPAARFGGDYYSDADPVGAEAVDGSARQVELDGMDLAGELEACDRSLSELDYP